MADAIYPQNLPPGYDAYLGYADGRWPDYLAVAAAHGNVPVYALTVFGTPGVGVGVDYEPGDATLAQAAQYLADTVRAGKVDRPIGYCSALMAKGLVDAVTALGIDRTAWRLLTAHTGQGAHICGPGSCGASPYYADGTQWNAAGAYDESLVSDHFLGAATYPGDEVTAQDIADITASVVAALAKDSTLVQALQNELTATIQPELQNITAQVLAARADLTNVENTVMADVAALRAQVAALPAPGAVSLKGETATITFS